MRFEDALRAGNILYRVDLVKLSIKVFRISSPDEEVNHATTNYEDFSVAYDKKRFPLPYNKFPFEFNGHMYFLSEDDANDFIKTQIGM